MHPTVRITFRFACYALALYACARLFIGAQAFILSLAR